MGTINTTFNFHVGGAGKCNTYDVAWTLNAPGAATMTKTTPAITDGMANCSTIIEGTTSCFCPASDFFAVKPGSWTVGATSPAGGSSCTVGQVDAGVTKNVTLFSDGTACSK